MSRHLCRLEPWKRITLPQFLTFINSQHPNQFIMEIVQNNQISFLNVLVRKKEGSNVKPDGLRPSGLTKTNTHGPLSPRHPSRKLLVTTVGSASVADAPHLANPDLHPSFTKGVFLGEIREGRGAALVLQGEAGIGKTALLEWAAGQADGMRVLRATGIESELELAFSGLAELCLPRGEYDASHEIFTPPDRGRGRGSRRRPAGRAGRARAVTGKDHLPVSGTAGASSVWPDPAGPRQGLLQGGGL